jgi:hypothetical protein
MHVKSDEERRALNDPLHGCFTLDNATRMTMEKRLFWSVFAMRTQMIDGDQTHSDDSSNDRAFKNENCILPPRQPVVL